jgi:hypothetical protein
MTSLADIRKQYPQYNELPDQDLADRLYDKFYADKIERADFYTRVGFTPTTPAENPQVADARPSLANPTLITPEQSGTFSDVINNYVVEPVKETGRILGNAATNVTANTLDFPLDIMEATADSAAIQAAQQLTQTERGQRLIGDTPPEQIQAAAQQSADSFKSTLGPISGPVREQTTALRGLVEDPKTMPGQIATGLLEFLAPYKGARLRLENPLTSPLAPKVPTAPKLPEQNSLKKDFAAGAMADTLQQPDAGNLSSLIQETSLANPLTEILATDPEGNPFANRLRNIVEGGIMGLVAESALDAVAAVFGLTPKALKDIRAEDIDDEVLDEIIASPEARRVLEANGILNPNEEGYQEALARVQQRLDARVRRQDELRTDEGAQRQAELEDEIDNIQTQDPQNRLRPGEDPTQAALRRAAAVQDDTVGLRAEELRNQQDAPGIIRAADGSQQGDVQYGVADPRGQIEDPGVQAGLARQRQMTDQRALPSPEDPRLAEPVRGMSSIEIAQAQARARSQGAPARAVDDADDAASAGENVGTLRPKADDTLIAPEGRAPQTRTDVAEQRAAGQAFNLAERQRGRITDDSLDTQAGGRPQGVDAQPVALDEDFPVQILSTRAVPTARGGAEVVATVRRYDPRTSEFAPDSIEYEIPLRNLRQFQYPDNVRQATDFANRSKGPLTPENPRRPNEPVSREPNQTFRATTPDANESFPGAGSRPRDGGGDSPRGGPAQGRSPFPEQPDGPAPGPQRPSTEEDLIREFEERQRQQQQRGTDDFDFDTKEQYTGKDAPKSSTKAKAQDAEGLFEVDDNGFVRSDKGGPVKFKTQLQAGKWIIYEGHKKSLRQTFEIANHPDGKGQFTVRETVRAEAEQPKSDTGNGKQSRPEGDSAEPTPASASGRALPPPSADNAEKIDLKNYTEDLPPGYNALLAGPARVREVRQEWRAIKEQILKDAEELSLNQADVDARLAREAQKYLDEIENLKNDLNEEGLRKTNPRAKSEPETPQGNAPETPRASASGEPELPGFLRRTPGDTPEKKVRNWQNKFYSNPLDPQLWKDWFGREADRIVDDVQQVLKSLAGDNPVSFKNVLKGTVALPVKASEAIAAVARIGLLDNDWNLRILANKFKTPDGKPNEVITEIANMFFAPVGRVDQIGVGKTYGSAIDERVQTNLTKLEKLLNPISTMTKTQQRQILDQIGRKIRTGNIRAGDSFVDNAAAAIKKMMRAELNYLRDAGVQIGDFGENFYPRELDMAAIWKDPEKFVKQAEALYRAEGATREEAKKLAQDWFDALVDRDLGFKADGNEFVNIGASGTASASRFEKKRTFSNNADRIMADFYLNNPADVLPQYFLRAARRAEWVRRFGAKNEKWDELMGRLRESGAGSTRSEIKDIVFSSAGFFAPPQSGWGRGSLSFFRNLGVVTYLGRATLASLSEPAVAAIRSGNVKDALNAFIFTLRGDVVAKMVGIKDPAAKREAAKALAEDLGRIGRVADSTLMAQRFGGQVDGQFAQLVQNEFFLRTGLHHFTESSRVAATSIAQVYVRRLAKDLLNPKTKTRASTEFMLGELGLSKDQMEGFARWVADNNDGFPNPRSTRDGAENGDLYRTAISRFVDQTIMKPRGIEKPRFANHPVGALFYHLLSYTYAFQANVLNRAANMAKTGIKGGDGLNMYDRLRLMAPMAFLPILPAIQYGIGEARDILLDDPGRDPETKERTGWEKTALAFSRAGTLGIADLAVNLVTGVKFSRDPATFMVGPIFGGLSEGFKATVDLGSDRNSPNTNTAERRAHRLLYDIAVKPAMATTMSLLPGFPGRVIGAIGIQYVGLPSTREKIVSRTAGPPQWKTKGGGFEPNAFEPGTFAPKAFKPAGNFKPN